MQMIRFAPNAQVRVGVLESDGVVRIYDSDRSGALRATDDIVRLADVTVLAGGTALRPAARPARADAAIVAVPSSEELFAVS